MNILSCRINAYSCMHWEAAKHVICYLKTTLELAICYKGDNTHTATDFPQGFANTDWGGNNHSRRLTTGLVRLICWGLCMQKCVVTSTTEAELNALAEMLKEAIHLHDLCHELLPKLDCLIALCMDNQGKLMIIN